MIKDLRKSMNLSGEMRVCYLAEDSAHITSPTFKVFIPDIMGSEIFDKSQNDTGDYTEEADTKILLNTEKTNFGKPVNCQGYLIARSACPYGHRLDGYIQKLTVDKIEHPTGRSDNMTASSTRGRTDGVGSHPSHPISMKFTMNSNKHSNTEFTNSTFTGLHGVDFQNIHNKVIKRGHKLYGSFVVGEQNQFIIFAIDNAVPYLAGSEVREDSDRADGSFDGGSSNADN